MPARNIFDMPFSRVYPLLVQKAVRKGRTAQEVDEILFWLTGHSRDSLCRELEADTSCRQFFADAPAWNPRSELVKGAVCGVRVEQVEDPILRRIRILDKMIDELAKGKPMETILR